MRLHVAIAFATSLLIAACDDKAGGEADAVQQKGSEREIPMLGVAGVDKRETNGEPSGIRKTLEHIKEPIDRPESRLIGLTEAEVLKKQGLETMQLEAGSPDKKSFGGGRLPGVRGGYIWGRFNILTFESGKVARHELVDRPVACVLRQPRRER